MISTLFVVSYLIFFVGFVTYITLFFVSVCTIVEIVDNSKESKDAKDESKQPEEIRITCETPKFIADLSADLLPRTVFLTFGAGAYRRRLNTIYSQAKSMNFFNSIVCLTDDDLDNEFKSKFKEHFGSRGFGYWSWKPHIIKMMLERLRDNDILIYTDAGCTLNPGGLNRLKEYVEMARKSEVGLLAFELEHQCERSWSKRDLVNYLNVSEEHLESRQLVGGIHIWRKCSESLALATRWDSIASQDNLFYVSDAKRNTTVEDPLFKDHRHDQSIFSLLVKQDGRAAIVLDDSVDFGNPLVPIMATRLSE